MPPASAQSAPSTDSAGDVPQSLPPPELKAAAGAMSHVYNVIPFHPPELKAAGVPPVESAPAPAQPPPPTTVTPTDPPKSPEDGISQLLAPVPTPQAPNNPEDHITPTVQSLNAQANNPLSIPADANRAIIQNALASGPQPPQIPQPPADPIPPTPKDGGFPPPELAKPIVSSQAAQDQEGFHPPELAGHPQEIKDQTDLNQGPEFQQAQESKRLDDLIKPYDDDPDKIASAFKTHQIENLQDAQVMMLHAQSKAQMDASGGLKTPTDQEEFQADWQKTIQDAQNATNWLGKTLSSWRDAFLHAPVQIPGQLFGTAENIANIIAPSDTVKGQEPRPDASQAEQAGISAALSPAEAGGGAPVQPTYDNSKTSPEAQARQTVASINRERAERALVAGLEEGTAEHSEWAENAASHLIGLSSSAPNAMLKLFGGPEIGYIDPKVQVMMASRGAPIRSDKAYMDMDPNQMAGQLFTDRMQTGLHAQRSQGWVGQGSQDMLNAFAGRTVDTPEGYAAKGFPVPLKAIQDTAATANLGEGMLSLGLVGRLADAAGISSILNTTVQNTLKGTAGYLETGAQRLSEAQLPPAVAKVAKSVVDRATSAVAAHFIGQQLGIPSPYAAVIGSMWKMPVADFGIDMLGAGAGLVSKATTALASHAADALKLSADDPDNLLATRGAAKQILTLGIRRATEGVTGIAPALLGAKTPEDVGSLLGMGTSLGMVAHAVPDLAGVLQNRIADSAFVTDTNWGQSRKPADPPTPYGTNKALDQAHEEAINSLDPATGKPSFSNAQKHLINQTRDQSDGMSEIYVLNPKPYAAELQRMQGLGWMNDPVMNSRGVAIDPNPEQNQARVLVRADAFNDAFHHELAHPIISRMELGNPDDLSTFFQAYSRTNDPNDFTTDYTGRATLGRQSSTYDELPSQTEINNGTGQYVPGLRGMTKEDMQREMATEALSGLLKGGSIRDLTRDPTMFHQTQQAFWRVLDGIGIDPTTSRSNTALGLRQSIQASMVLEPMVRDTLRRNLGQGASAPPVIDRPNPNARPESGLKPQAGATTEGSAGGPTPVPPTPEGAPQGSAPTPEAQTPKPQKPGPNVNPADVIKGLTGIGWTKEDAAKAAQTTAGETWEQVVRNAVDNLRDQKTAAKSKGKSTPADIAKQSLMSEKGFTPEDAERLVPNDIKDAVEAIRNAVQAKAKEVPPEATTPKQPKEVPEEAPKQEGQTPPETPKTGTPEEPKSGIPVPPVPQQSGPTPPTPSPHAGHVPVPPTANVPPQPPVTTPPVPNISTSTIVAPQVEPEQQQKKTEASKENPEDETIEQREARETPAGTTEGSAPVQKHLRQQGKSPGRAQREVHHALKGEAMPPLAHHGAGNIGFYGYAGDTSWDHGSLRGVGAFPHVSKPGSLVPGYSAGLTKEGAAMRGVRPGQEFVAEDGKTYRYDDTAPTDFDFQGKHHHVPADYVDVYSPMHEPDAGMSAEQIAANQAYMAQFGIGSNGQRGPISVGEAAVEHATGVPPPPSKETPQVPSTPKAEEPAKAPEKVTAESIQAAEDAAHEATTQGARQSDEAYTAAIQKQVMQTVGEQHAASLAPDDQRVRYDASTGNLVGKYFDPTDPFHQWLLNGTSQQSQHVIKAIQGSIQAGQDLWIDYNSAPQQAKGTATASQRAEAQAESEARDRAKGIAPSQQAGKNIIPSYVGASLGKRGEPSSLYYGGVSPDKVASNASQIVQRLGPESPYKAGPAGDPVAEEDMRGYLHNVSNGWKGDGSAKLKPTPGANLPMESPGFTPYTFGDNPAVAKAKANFWNLAVQGKGAGLSEGAMMDPETSSGRARAMALGNEGYVSGETKPPKEVARAVAAGRAQQLDEAQERRDAELENQAHKFDVLKSIQDHGGLPTAKRNAQLATSAGGMSYPKGEIADLHDAWKSLDKDSKAYLKKNYGINAGDLFTASADHPDKLNARVSQTSEVPYDNPGDLIAAAHDALAEMSKHQMPEVKSSGVRAGLTNPLHAKIEAETPGWTKETLHSGYERLLADNTVDILPSGESASEQIHPGHEAVARALREGGYPPSGIVKSGFMPGEEVSKDERGRREFAKTPAVMGPSGRIEKAAYHGAAWQAHVDQLEKDNPGSSRSEDYSYPRYREGFITDKGRFVLRDPETGKTMFMPGELPKESSSHPEDEMLAHAFNPDILTPQERLKKNAQLRANLEKQQAKLDTTKPEEDKQWDEMAKRIRNLENEHQQGAENLNRGGALFMPDAKSADLKDLVAMHNTSEEGIAHAARLGGFPVPSLAVTKKSIPFNSFGDYTLIAHPDVVDPERGTHVFDRDTYTKTQPAIKSTWDKKKAEQIIAKEIKPASAKVDGQGPDSSNLYQFRDALDKRVNSIGQEAYYNDTARIAYLDSIGKLPPIEHEPLNRSSIANTPGVKEGVESLTPEEREQLGEYRTSEVPLEKVRDRVAQEARQFYEAKGLTEDQMKSLIDTHRENIGWGNIRHYLDSLNRNETKMTNASDDAIRKAVEENGGSKAIQKYLDDLFEPARKDTYFEGPRGKKMGYNLQNLTDAMSGGPIRGAQKTMVEGLGKASATGAHRIGSVQEMHNRSEWMLTDPDKTKSYNDDTQEQYFHALDPLPFDQGGQWEKLDAGSKAIAQYKKGPKTTAGMQNALFRQGFGKADAYALDAMKRVADRVHNAQTDYFEAKPQRAVKLNEFTAAVVPQDVKPETEQLLKDNGINTIEKYDRSQNNAPELRRQAVEKASEQAKAQFMPARQEPEKYANKEMFDSAANTHGVTRRLDEAGYILPDGRLLDFSGRHESPDYHMAPSGQFVPNRGRDEFQGVRYTDHRKVEWKGMPEDQGFNPMDYFVQNGAVRIGGREGAIHVGPEPITGRQQDQIKNLADDHNGKVSVDVYGRDGNVAHGKLYDEGTKPVRIVNDIKRTQAQFMPERNLKPGESTENAEHREFGFQNEPFRLTGETQEGEKPKAEPMAEDTRQMSMFMPGENRERQMIDSPAVRLPNGKIYTGDLHKDALLKAIRDPDVPNNYWNNRDVNYENGFSTGSGRFVDRKEGWQIAKRYGQLKAGVRPYMGNGEPELSAEDLRPKSSGPLPGTGPEESDSKLGSAAFMPGDVVEGPARTRDELKEDPNVWWHGSPSGDMRGGSYGLHLGTHEAAKQALEARIGIPASGEWDGTREYGKTLLAGQKTLKTIDPRGYNVTGHNVDAPEEDYYPSSMPEYSNGSRMSTTDRPSIAPFRLTGEMTNDRTSPHEDSRANSLMRGSLKKGNARRGYYYTQVGEDAGSTSIVVPNSRHVAPIEVKGESPKSSGPLPGTGPEESQSKPGAAFMPSEKMVEHLENPQVKTKEFQKWFKGSKVTDQNGDPLRLYHGTTQDFDTHDPNKTNGSISDWGRGIYMSNNPEDVSANYTGEGEHAESQEHGGHASIQPLYSSLKNPVEIGGPRPTRWSTADLGDYREAVRSVFDNLGAHGPRDAVEAADRSLRRVRSGDNPYAGDVLDRLRSSPEVEELTHRTKGEYSPGAIAGEVLRTMGHDGVIDHEPFEKWGGDEYQKGMPGLTYDTTHVIAFDPENVKSATGNRGTFSPRSGNVNFMPMAGEKATGFEQAEREGRTFPGVFGSPRFEINDKDATYTKPRVGDTVKLSDVLDHPDLYENYPSLKDVEFTRMKLPQGEGARYSPVYNWIQAAPGATKAEVIHEVQHAIQTQEGDAGGTNLTNAQRGSNWARTVPYLNDLYDQINPVESKANSQSPEQYQSYLNQRDRHKTAIVRQAVTRAYPMGEYLRNTGEREAFEAQARTNLSPEERASTPPSFDPKYDDRLKLGQSMEKYRPIYEAAMRGETGPPTPTEPPSASKTPTYTQGTLFMPDRITKGANGNNVRETSDYEKGTSGDEMVRYRSEGVPPGTPQEQEPSVPINGHGPMDAYAGHVHYLPPGKMPAEERSSLIDTPDRVAKIGHAQAMARQWLAENPMPKLSATYSQSKLPKDSDMKVEDLGDWIEGKNKNLDLKDPAVRTQMARAVTYDIMKRLSQDGSGLDWYDAIPDAAVKYVADHLDPSINANDENRTMYRLALATTSNGQNVYNNAETAYHAFQYFKQHDQLPTDKKDFVGGGVKINSMIDTFKMLNDLRNDLGGTKALEDLLNKKMTVREMRDMDLDIGGEAPDYSTHAALALGPKIGSFYSALGKHFEHLVMDMWFKRTMNRMIGDMFKFSPTAFHSQIGSLSRSIKSGEVEMPDEQKSAILSEIGNLQGRDLTRHQAVEESPELQKWVHDTHKEFAKEIVDPDGTSRTYPVEKRNPINYLSKNIDEGLHKTDDSPAQAERPLYREIMEKALKNLKKAGIDMHMADAQAIAWFVEQSLYKDAGAANKGSDTSDYLDGAYSLVAQQREHPGRPAPTAPKVPKLPKATKKALPMLAPASL